MKDGRSANSHFCTRLYRPHILPLALSRVAPVADEYVHATQDVIVPIGK